MFRSITFNGTDKKQIGAPIIRKTNEMIYEFDLQYERNYKIVKVISQREIEFQEYLKQQEALQFRLDNLIKILRNYFKENNFNSNTYYALFKPTRIRSIKKRKKRRKKIRPKSAEIKHNKYYIDIPYTRSFIDFAGHHHFLKVDKNQIYVPTLSRDLKKKDNYSGFLEMYLDNDNIIVEAKEIYNRIDNRGIVLKKRL